METYTGILNNVRIINMDPFLIRFTIETPYKNLSCIVVNHKIANNLLLMPERQYVLKVTGRFSKRNQFVAMDVQIKNTDDTIKRLEL